jgi:integrase
MHANCCVVATAGIRDRALLLIGLAGAFRRSELVALNIEDIELREDGLKVAIRKSKTDQEGAGQVIGIAYGSKLCPVRSRCCLRPRRLLQGRCSVTWTVMAACSIG